MTAQDWNPELYGRFGDVRLRPALDLLARVGGLPAGDIVDLGCGAGPVGPALAQRFPDRRITGVDTSRSMLAKARETGAYADLVEGDIASWQPEAPATLIFSNAALQWLGDHDSLLPALARRLAPGGTLAVQMPRQNRAPSHRIWRDLVEDNFPGRAAAVQSPVTLDPVEYHRILAPLGRLFLWETEYFQILPAADTGHPVRHFTSSTFARPILDALDEGERVMIEKLYDEAMEAAYPRSANGSVLFPFRRLFFTLDIG
ncbi:methyltransferase domain-containing protein [Pseudooceanicola sp. LIPI14-2-Ac024]|uniref:methyltransferase domain-containing protein n=1 Tax=Pseudooceanicola sp. LIPI14-2-Ac024 TaxID=3344875 RepID=UPI0035CF2018